MQVFRVPGANIPAIWPFAVPLIEKALEHGVGQFEADDLRGLCESGDRQLWIGVDDQAIVAVCITRIVVHPQKQSMYISHAAGRLDDIPVFWPFLKEFAAEQGCSFVMHEGRPGWGRSGKLPNEFRHAADIWVAEV